MDTDLSPIVLRCQVDPVGAHTHVRVFAGRGPVALTGTLVMAPEDATELDRRLKLGELDTLAGTTLPEAVPVAAAEEPPPALPEPVREALARFIRISAARTRAGALEARNDLVTAILDAIAGKG